MILLSALVVVQRNHTLISCAYTWAPVNRIEMPCLQVVCALFHSWQ